MALSPELTAHSVDQDENQRCAATEQLQKSHCTFCGFREYHPRSQCPARRSKCFKRGYFKHFAKECRSCKLAKKTSATMDNPNFLTALSGKTESKVHYSITVDGNKAKTFVDMGSTLNRHKEYAKKHQLETHSEASEISMTFNGNRSQSNHYCMVSIKLQERIYKRVKLVVLDSLFVDVILPNNFSRTIGTFRLILRALNLR